MLISTIILLTLIFRPSFTIPPREKIEKRFQPELAVKKTKVYLPLILSFPAGRIIGKIYSTIDNDFCKYQPVWSPQVFESDGKYYWILDTTATGADLTDELGFFDIKVTHPFTSKNIIPDTYVIAVGMPDTWEDPFAYLIIFNQLIYAPDGVIYDMGVLFIDLPCYFFLTKN